MYPFTIPNVVAGGNVYPSRWICAAGATAGYAKKVVTAAGATLPLLGITHRWTRYAAGAPGDDGYHAIAGESVGYQGPGQVAELQICAGTAVTDLRIPLTSDTDGTGKPVDPSGVASTTWYGALPLAIGAVGEFIPVFILSPFAVNKAGA